MKLKEDQSNEQQVKSKIHSSVTMKHDKLAFSKVTRVPKCNNRHSCLPVYPEEGSCYVFSDPKQLLRVSCILWCYYPKYHLIILENASLWCFIVIL